MEIRSLIRVLRTKWWLVVPTFLVAFGVAAFLTLIQPRLYQSQSTYVVKVSDAGDDVLSALGLLSRRTEIAETYAQAGQSRRIRDQAIAELGLNDRQKDDVELESQLVPGSNLLQLTVTSRDPDLAKDYCDAVGASLVEYAAGLYPSFELVALDAAAVPERPFSPNIPLNLGFGFAVAVALAVAVGIAAAIMTPARGATTQMDILDRDTPAYNADFFSLRLHQEMSRTRRTHAPLCVALVNLNHFGTLDRADVLVRREAMRRLAGLLGRHLRPEDISAHLNEDVFALLLCDINEREATQMVDELRARISTVVVGVDPAGDALRARTAAGLVEFSGEAITPEELVARARRALEDAESVPAGTTQPFSRLSSGSPAERQELLRAADTE